MVAIVEQHRADLTALRALALSDLDSVVSLIRGMEAAAARELLKEVLVDLMDPFMGAASDSAAVLLEELYAQAGMRVPGIPPAALLTPDRVDSLARWAVAPLADDSLDSTVLSRLTGAVTRMIFNSARMTTVDGVTRAPEGHRVFFQRMPRADCCAFCGLLASRPAEMSYRTADTAGIVVGRGSTRTGFDASGKRLSGGIGGGIKARGLQQLGSRFHDDCRCLVMPIFRGPAAEAITASREQWLDKYAAVASENAHGARDLKATLREWRSEYGTH